MVTDWAYQQACAAIEKHRARADALAAELDELRQKVEQNNSRALDRCARRRQSLLACGVEDCGVCPRRYIIELPDEPAKG